PRTTGEHKTKPTQASVRELRGLGLSPDVIVCRSEKPIDENVKQKISNFCHVPPEEVVCLHDVKSVYHVPIFLEEQGLVKFFHERLKLPVRKHSDEVRNRSKQWKNLIKKIDSLVQEVNIALVGKYTGLEDAYASVIKSLHHASMHCNLKLNLQFIAAADLEPETLRNDAVRYHEGWQKLCKSDGIIVPGGFGTNGIEGKISAIKWARESKKPFLGICLGFQLAVVEFARNVLGWEDAHTIETTGDKTKRNVVIEMEEHHTGIMGGTMRLGKKVTMFKTTDSVLWQLYGRKDFIEERHRHRYEVDKAYVPDMERAGLKFVGEDDSGERLEILELPDHPYFVAVQFHPEYISRPTEPSPPYLGLILASSGKLSSFLARGCHHRFLDCEITSEDEIETGEEESASLMNIQSVQNS
ncbi:CTP synthase 1-like, partial [Stegodyphus dumicola]|uniref:CTP synthase 1-like n=1 Tax=Stegodyphus dumicola TaxID=202533 RepID=UPI0015AD8B67